MPGAVRRIAVACTVTGIALGVVACGDRGREASPVPDESAASPVAAEPQPVGAADSVYNEARADEIRAGWERARSIPLVPVELTPNPLDDLLLDPGLWSTDFSVRAVPVGEFSPGGPPKDGIPAPDRPALVSVDDADAWLAAEEPVVELVLDGEARAYPLRS